jgi:hypothetical protein
VDVTLEVTEGQMVGDRRPERRGEVDDVQGDLGRRAAKRRQDRRTKAWICSRSIPPIGPRAESRTCRGPAGLQDDDHRGKPRDGALSVAGRHANGRRGRARVRALPGARAARRDQAGTLSGGLSSMLAIGASARVSPRLLCWTSRRSPVADHGDEMFEHSAKRTRSQASPSCSSSSASPSRSSRATGVRPRSRVRITLEGQPQTLLRDEAGFLRATYRVSPPFQQDFAGWRFH